jgi:transcription elongation factor Elf1
MIYKCSKCGSQNVEALSWVDLNSNEVIGGDADEFYCRSCGMSTDITVEEGDDDDIDFDESATAWSG